MTLDLVTELIAIRFRYRYHNNHAIYNIFNGIELPTYCLYFNYSIDVFRKRRLGWWLAGGAIILWTIMWFHYPKDTLGERYIICEGILIICISFFSLFRMLLQVDEAEYEAPKPTANIHFWLLCGILFFWCISYLNLVTYAIYIFPLNNLAMWLVCVGNIGMTLFSILALLRFTPIRHARTI